MTLDKIRTKWINRNRDEYQINADRVMSNDDTMSLCIVI